MKPKGPSNQPAIGDRVRLRGRPAIGTIETINKLNWVHVKWTGEGGPILVHLYELEKLR